MVDFCAAEFAAKTPYYYSTYEPHGDNRIDILPDLENRVKRRQVVIGSGPIRIGQGIEFDYGCVHAVKAIREAGMDAVLMNNNPETVSTDFDTSDRLYFEPLTLEYVTEVLPVRKRMESYYNSVDRLQSIWPYHSKQDYLFSIWI